MSKDFAIVLSSGSINSAVAIALAAQRYRLIMLHMRQTDSPSTTSTSASRRRVAFDQQTAHFKPYREQVIEMPALSLPQGAGARRMQVESAPSRPHSPQAQRLLELLPLFSAAARLASHYEAAAIYLGLRAGPESDNLARATEFVQIWQELLQQPCALSELELAAPLLDLEPWQAVDLGSQLNVPFERTWSCLADSAEPCWACAGCRSREAAFNRSARPDPLRTVRR
jgi:7-cyano-7-deazaguanine synthase in queuosine biosynthesis